MYDIKERNMKRKSVKWIINVRLSQSHKTHIKKYITIRPVDSKC